MEDYVTHDDVEDYEGVMPLFVCCCAVYQR